MKTWLSGQHSFLFNSLTLLIRDWLSWTKLKTSANVYLTKNVGKTCIWEKNIDKSIFEKKGSLMTLREKCLYLEFFLSVFTSIRTISLRIQSECGKIRTRRTPNTDTFYAVQLSIWRRETLRNRQQICIRSNHSLYNLIRWFNASFFQ